MFAPGDVTETVSVSVVGDRKVEPDEGFTVTLSATEATIDDGTGAAAITNDDTPHAPVLAPIDDVYPVVGETLEIDLTATDQNGDALTFSSADLPAFATLDDHHDGTATITVAPTAGDAGSHPNLHVTVSDGALSDTRTYSILVLTAPNHQPYPVDDRASTRGTAPVVIDVLRNDTDIDDDQLTIVRFDALGGRVDCGAAFCTFTPTANVPRLDTFTYTVSDGRGGRADASVTVRTFLNHPPTARNDAGAVHGSGSTAIKVLTNDFDPDGDSLTVTVLLGPSHGTVECGGVCTYTADGTTDSDSFTYRVSDGQGGSSAPATVDIAIAPNGSPRLNPDLATAHGSGSIGIGVTNNDFDPEGDPLSATLFGPPPEHGTATCAGTCTYTPPAIPPGGPGAYPYTATFQYTVDDGHGGSASGGLVTVTVVKDTAPTAKPDTMTALGYEPGFTGGGSSSHSRTTPTAMATRCPSSAGRTAATVRSSATHRVPSTHGPVATRPTRASPASIRSPTRSTTATARPPTSWMAGRSARSRSRSSRTTRRMRSTTRSWSTASASTTCS